MAYKYNEQGELVFDEEEASEENTARAYAPIAPPKVGRPEMPKPVQPDTGELDKAYMRDSGGGGFGTVGRQPNAVARMPPQPASASPADPAFGARRPGAS
jgi:hypothetical protein